MYSETTVLWVYRNLKSEWNRDYTLSPTAPLLTSLESMTHLLSEGDPHLGDRQEIMHHQQMFVNSIEILWRDVQSGRVHVDSIALLRAMRDVARYDLGRKLAAPTLECSKIRREIALLSNTLKHLLKPQFVR
ncbi:MAG: hypothetical protein EAX95_06875 [Candidatus Thorarchaeota archaeon]|nr:hypothetical protein [Candidatus Thorarchaeota archaeon]